jgi:hypothetical protein
MNSTLARRFLIEFLLDRRPAVQLKHCANLLLPILDEFPVPALRSETSTKQVSAGVSEGLKGPQAHFPSFDLFRSAFKPSSK